MPRKKMTQRRRKASDVEGRGRQALIAVAVVLSLVGVWTMLAYSGALTPTSSEKANRKQTVSIGSLNSNSSPSKEYIYAGSRLVATEEGSSHGS
jgi:cytoskeletal protein RodZ